MRRSILTLLVSLCSTVLATSALAGDFGRSGFYIGAGAGYSWEFLEDAIEDATDDIVDVDGAPVVNVRGGYRLASWFAAEAQYEYQGTFDTKVLGIKAAEGRTHSILASAKFILPLWRVQPYLNLGIGTQYSRFNFKGPLSILGDDDEWNFLGRPAGGVDVYITENLVLFAEIAGSLAVRDIRNLDATDTFTMPLLGGLIWRF